LNTVTLSGNLTRDPELLTTASGVSIAKGGIAVNERRKVNEEWIDVAHFFDFTMFGRRGELFAEKANKGDRVHILGRLEYQSWEKDGEKRSKVAVIANEVEGEFQFRPSGSGSATPATPASKPAAGDDDIPF
jgi:single-strand DNA-binding protein